LPWWNPDGATPGGVGGSCVAAWQAKSAASYAASKVNLANAGTYDLGEGNGVVPWASGTGWGFVAAATQYFTTGVTGDLTWSMLAQFSGVVAANAAVVGQYTGAMSVFYIRPNFGGNCSYGNGRQFSAAPGLETGNAGFADRTAYRNGVNDGAIAAGGVANANPVFIGCFNLFGAPALYVTADIYAIAIYNVTLTAPQVAARAAAMAAL
jgi:hypothetical protein